MTDSELMRAPAILGALFLVLLVLGALLAPDANGQTPAEKVTMEAAGAKTFPNSPCEGRVALVPSTMDQLKVLTGWALPTPEPGGAAMQDNADGACKVFVLDTLLRDDPYGACLVYVHEYGHLAGAHHGEALMGDLGYLFEPCRRILPVVTGYRAKMAVRAKIGTKIKGARYRVRCYTGQVGVGAVCEIAARLKSRRVIERSYGVDQARLGMPLKVFRLDA